MRAPVASTNTYRWSSRTQRCSISAMISIRGRVLICTKQNLFRLKTRICTKNISEFFFAKEPRFALYFCATVDNLVSTA
jgi:hypothetical protein